MDDKSPLFSRWWKWYLLVILVLGFIPYVLPNAEPHELGRWFPRGNRAAQIFMVLMVVVILLLTVWGAASK